MNSLRRTSISDTTIEAYWQAYLSTLPTDQRNQAYIAKPFGDSSEREGDLSLAYWRETHWHYFSRVLSKIAKASSLDMSLVYERFHVIYK